MSINLVAGIVALSDIQQTTMTKNRQLSRELKNRMVEIGVPSPKKLPPCALLHFANLLGGKVCLVITDEQVYFVDKNPFLDDLFKRLDKINP